MERNPGTLTIPDDIIAHEEIFPKLYTVGFYMGKHFTLTIVKHTGTKPSFDVDSHSLDLPNGDWANSFSYLKDALAEFFYLENGGFYTSPFKEEKKETE